jgi:hypothetical protein
MDIHMESDGRPIECWVTAYDAQGNQTECRSTHNEEVLRRCESVLDAFIFGTQLTIPGLSPFPV